MTVAGRIIKVLNKNKKTNANRQYLAVWVEDANGKNERCLIITEKELERIEYRSKRNVEDWTKKGILTDLFD